MESIIISHMDQFHITDAGKKVSNLYDNVDSKCFV